MEAAHDVKPQLGQVMVDHGLITADQLTHALAEQQRLGRPLGKLLVELGFVSEGAVANALAEQAGGLLKTEFGISFGLHGEAAQAVADERPREDPRLGELQARVDELEGERAALHDHVREVREIAEKAIAAEQTATAHVHELEEALRSTQPRLAQLTQQVESLRAELAAAETREPDTAREDSLLASLATLERELDASRARADELEDAERRRAQEVEALSAELESFRAQVAEAAPAAAGAAESEASAVLDRLLATAETLQSAAGAAEAVLREAVESRDAPKLAQLTGEVERLRAELTAERARSAEAAAPARKPDSERAHLLFVPSPKGYALVEREGPAPASGAVVGVDGLDFRVGRVGRAPIRGRDLRCAFLLPV